MENTYWNRYAAERDGRSATLASAAKRPRNEHAKALVSVAKVIVLHDRVEDFDRLMKVAQVMIENPRYFVCDSNVLQASCRISVLTEDEELELGHLYFLLSMVVEIKEGGLHVADLLPLLKKWPKHCRSSLDLTDLATIQEQQESR